MENQTTIWQKIVHATFSVCRLSGLILSDL